MEAIGPKVKLMWIYFIIQLISDGQSSLWINLACCKGMVFFVIAPFNSVFKQSWLTLVYALQLMKMMRLMRIKLIHKTLFQWKSNGWGHFSCISEREKRGNVNFYIHMKCDGNLHMWLKLELGDVHAIFFLLNLSRNKVQSHLDWYCQLQKFINNNFHLFTFFSLKITGYQQFLFKWRAVPLSKRR